MQPTTPTNLLSVTDLQNLAPELMNYISQFPAATLSGMLAQATRNVLNICQVKGFDRQLITDEGDAQISSEGNLEITIKQFPLQKPSDVVAVNLTKGGFSAALTLTDNNGIYLFQTPDPGWRFSFPNSYFYLTGTYLAGGSSQLLTLKGAHVLYQITYWGGFTTIPDDLKAATLLMFRDILKYTQNPFGATSWRQGQMSQSYGANAKGNSPMYDQAETMLYNGGYVRVAQF